MIGPGTAASFMNLGTPGRARVFTGLKEFSAWLKTQAAEEPLRLLALASSCAAVTGWAVKKNFGDDSKLAPNTATTQDLRSDGGEGGPLYINGKLLESSIETRAVSEGDGALMGVGSSSQILVWQEHGYMTAPDSMIPNKIVPPRPVFALGVYEAMPICQQLVLRMALPGAVWHDMTGTLASFMRPEQIMSGAGDVMNIARGQMPFQTPKSLRTGVFVPIRNI